MQLIPLTHYMQSCYLFRYLDFQEKHLNSINEDKLWVSKISLRKAAPHQTFLLRFEFFQQRAHSFA